MLNEDYREILQNLLEEKVKFILVGAYALGVHGFPRATGDIDLWVRPDINNSNSLIRALNRFGAPTNNIKSDDFTIEGIVFQIGITPRRVDIITSIDGVNFDDAYKEKIIVNVDGLNIPVISINNLIENKLATGREKDALDAKILKEHLKKKKKK